MAMELVDSQFMEIDLKMSKFGILTLTKVYYQWQMLDQTRMDLSSLFALELVLV